MEQQIIIIIMTVMIIFTKFFDSQKKIKKIPNKVKF